MKRGIFILNILITGLLALSSCKQSEERGRLTLGFELMEESLQKSTSQDYYLSTALLSIAGEDGALVYDKEPVELIRFGSSLVTRSLELPAGAFVLTEFMLTDTLGTVLWATPKEGSNLAGLVDDPLPREFRIHADQSTSINIQVVRVGNYSPDDFGYVEFYIDFVEYFCFKVYYKMILPEGYWDSLRGPKGRYMPWYESRIEAWSGKRMVLDEVLSPGLNRFKLPVTQGDYHLIATGLLKDTLLNEIFSLDELSSYGCDPDFPALKIPGDDPNIYITPEELYSPSIKQGVFGQLTGPLDMFMDSTLYDIKPLVKDICFFPYSVLDSIYTLAPIDCHIPFEFITMEPELAVRSNSEGFFQAGLQQGEYLYLVRCDQGYYMDAWISSHKPGYVKVSPGEITELSIHVLDCSMWQ